jgi:hypothetical protein
MPPLAGPVAKRPQIAILNAQKKALRDWFSTPGKKTFQMHLLGGAWNMDILLAVQLQVIFFRIEISTFIPVILIQRQKRIVQHNGRF